MPAYTDVSQRHQELQAIAHELVDVAMIAAPIRTRVLVESRELIEDADLDRYGLALVDDAASADVVARGDRDQLMAAVDRHQRACAERLGAAVAHLARGRLRDRSRRLEPLGARLAVCAATTGSAEHADALLHLTKLTAGEHIAFAERAARGCAVDTSPALQAALARARERLADNDFRLALVGEFSSGKSTFINALLDEPPLFPEKWLKTSSLATTGAETEVRHGKLALEARLAGTPDMLAFTGPDCVLARAIARHLDGEPLPADITGMLRVMTTDARLAGVVEGVRLTHPDPLLGEHVVLVDTPGINANEAYEHHADVTRRAVQRADTALVFVPADRPLSMALMRFLEEELEPYLPRCVFVVSRLARIEPNERNAVIAWVRVQITERLGLPDPPVLGAALNVAEAYARDPASVADGDLHWVEQFSQLERTLHERLGRQRAHVVSESALRVVEQLVRALHAHLSEEREQLAGAQRELEASSVRPVDDVARELRKAATDRINSAVKNVKAKGSRSIARERRALASAIRAKLAKADKAQLKRLAASALEPLAARAEAAVTAALVDSTSQLTGTAESVAREIALRFSEEYRSLGPPAEAVRTAAREVEPFDATSTIAHALDTYALRWLVHKPDTRVPYDIEDYSYLAISAVRHWFKTTDEVRAELLAAILGPVDRAFDRIETQFADRLAAWRANERKLASADIKARANAYSDVVAALRAEQAYERERLRSLVDETQAAIEEAERRLVALRRELGRLDAVAGALA